MLQVKFLLCSKKYERMSRQVGKGRKFYQKLINKKAVEIPEPWITRRRKNYLGMSAMYLAHYISPSAPFIELSQTQNI